MNKIEEMIKQLCPNGVEWKKLGEVCTIVRGASPRPIQKFLTKEENGVAWIKIGDATPGSKFITSCEEKITKEGSLKSRLVHKGDFILSNSMSFGRPFILGIDGCIHDGWIAMSDFEKIALPDYFYYMLLTEPVQNYWAMKANSGGAVSNLNADIVRSTPIPLPSLPIQTEIVRILDKFVEQQEQLERLIELRKKQYEYYREEMLKPKEGEKWETMRLGEIGTFVRGNGLQKTDFREEGVGCIHYGQIYTYYGMFTNKTKSFVSSELASKLKKVEQGDIVLACTSENIEDVCMCVVWEGEETIVTGGHSSIYKHNENPRFIAYFLKSKAFEVQKIKYAYGAKVIDIKNDDLEKIYILLPSREKQDKIVDFLNKFEYSIDSLTIALEASKKRYEYYRNEMMRF